MAGPQPLSHATSRPNRNSPIPAIAQLTPEIKASMRILIVDDERTLRESCASVLQYEGYQVSLCSRGEEAKDLLKRTAFDIVLLDLYMGEVSGMVLLRASMRIRHDRRQSPEPSLETSLEALRAGAWDYLPKPFSATHLSILVGRAAHAVMVARESRAIHASFSREEGGNDLVRVLGTAPGFRRALELAERVAPTDASVFITGGGAAKADRQFIPAAAGAAVAVINQLRGSARAFLETEVRTRQGAFTGAVATNRGSWKAGAAARCSTSWSECPNDQAKLLRVIQRRRGTPRGE
jgi:DNA-binding NtrC family response regulator